MEWEHPAALPRFEDDEIKAKRAEYTAKHGYYVSYPRIRDIIHVRRHEEPTEAEYLNWKQKNVKFLGQKRYDEITQIIEDKRRRYRTIVASPLPSAVRNYVSTLTFLDDINDALGTAGIVMRFLARLAPRALARFFLGPAGWLFIAAAIISLIMEMMRKFWMRSYLCMFAKRGFYKYGRMNPWSKESKARRARKLKRLWPSWGELIELFQVTDAMFGIGICLGPLFGFAFDFIAGHVRSVRGERVTWLRDPPPLRAHEKTASRVLRAAPFAAHVNPILTEEEHIGMYWALLGSAQVMEPYWKLWDPLDNIPTLDGLEIEAPRPWAPTTLHVLAEHNWNGRDGIGWPGTDKRWSRPQQIAEINREPAGRRFKEFAERNRNNYGAAFGAQAGADFFKTLLAQISDDGKVEDEWEKHHKGWANFMENGCQTIECKNAFRLGSFRYQISLYRFDDKVLHVYCSCLPPRGGPYLAFDTGMVSRCRDCEPYFSTEMCLGHCKDHVFILSWAPYVPEAHDPWLDKAGPVIKG